MRPSTFDLVRPTFFLPSVRPSVCSSVRPSVRTSARPFALPSVRASVRSFVRSSDRSSVCSSIRPSVRPSFLPPSIHSSVPSRDYVTCTLSRRTRRTTASKRRPTHVHPVRSTSDQLLGSDRHSCSGPDQFRRMSLVWPLYSSSDQPTLVRQQQQQQQLLPFGPISTPGRRLTTAFRIPLATTRAPVSRCRCRGAIDYSKVYISTINSLLEVYVLRFRPVQNALRVRSKSAGRHRRSAEVLLGMAIRSFTSACGRPASQLAAGRPVSLWPADRTDSKIGP